MAATGLDEATIFNGARQIADADERRRYVLEACGEDAMLQARIEALLRVHEQEPGFLDLPAEGVPAEPGERVVSDGPGTQIGPYKLIEQIGEGGFGVVFMAEQRPPLRRTVALKVLKPGMDTHQVVARFEAERQALGLMDHPNIAHVLDGGETASGRPYFVMELVKGVPITQYCDEQQLTLPQRLTLFVHVCQAVQHAHQKGIIHRDLKPTNILVASYDGEPVPKVIDFGVAKALGERLTERTLMTGFGAILGTLEYMSPEQAEFNALDVDTRADIYSLGVLLYELLTGTTPLTKERLKQAGTSEVLRLIREEEPPKPSSRLSPTKHSLVSVSPQRKLDIARLTKQVRGELDWIVMKALDKDRSRRYATANALARDIERYLHDEPVEAGPPTVAYRMRKFARRHRGPVLAATLLLLAILAGIIGTSIGFVQARAERRDKELARQEAVASAEKAKESAVEAKEAARQKTEQLWQSQLNEARYYRLRKTTGQRFESLGALAKAAKNLRVVPHAEDDVVELRNEAILSMVLADLRVAHEWDLKTPWRRGTWFDATLEHYAVSHGDEYGGEGHISIRRLADHQETVRLPGFGVRVVHVRFSAGGRLAVVKYHSHQAGWLYVWDLHSAEAVLKLPDSHSDCNGDFSSDNRFVALGRYAEQSVYVYDLNSMDLLDPDRPFKRIKIGLQPIDIRFRPDGTALAVAGHASPVVKVCHIDSEKIVPLPHPAPVVDIAWNNEETLLATCCQNGALYVWEVPTFGQLALPRQINVLRHQDRPPVAGLFNRAGDLVISRSADYTTRLWDRRTGRELVSADNRSAHQFSRDERWLAFHNGRSKFGVWEVATGRESRLLRGHVERLYSVDIHPNGRLMASAGYDGIRLWNLAAQQEGDKHILLLDKKRTVSVIFHPDGQSLIASGDGGLARWPIRLDPQTGAVQPGPRQPIEAATGQCIYACLGADGKRMALIPKNGQALLFDLDQPSQVVQVEYPHLESVSLSSDGRWLVTGTWQGTGAVIWNAQTGQQVTVLPVRGNATGMFSPDSQLLVTGAAEEFCIWEAGSWQPLRRIPRRAAGALPGHPVFTPDGRMLALDLSPEAVGLFDPTTGRTFATLPANKPLCFSPEGSQLATHGENHSIQLWDLRRIRRQLSEIGLDWDPPLPIQSSVQGQESRARE